jgi:D-inositol-3-phosphate glycosyltransferase
VSKSMLERYRGEFSRQLAAFVAREQAVYDLVHSHYWVSGWIGDALRRAWQVPHVVQFHTLGAIKDFAWSGQRESRRRIAIEGRLIARADAIIASSYEEREAMVQRYGAAREKVTVIPAGVDLDLFHPYDRQLARSRLGLPLQARIAFYAGRIEPFKGLDLLLEAVAALEDREDVLLLIAGGSGEDAEVRRLKLLGEQLGLNGEVRFLGTVPHDDLAWYYSAANVCAFPSYHETFGLAALEAMACGTPVVATSAGGLRALIRDGETGYLVSWHCPDPFAERLNVLLRHERLQEAMGRAARARAEEFPWSAVARQVVSLYRRFVAPSLA